MRRAVDLIVVAFSNGIICAKGMAQTTKQLLSAQILIDESE
jgi:hypothetical protein